MVRAAIATTHAGSSTACAVSVGTLQVTPSRDQRSAVERVSDASARERERARQVRGHRRVPVAVGDRLERRAQVLRAREVDEDVDVVTGGREATEERASTPGRRHRTLRRTPGFPATRVDDRRDCRLARFRPSRGDDDLRARACERVRHREAGAARTATGDDRPLRPDRSASRAKRAYIAAGRVRRSRRAG
jgi:hypothetical protein